MPDDKLYALTTFTFPAEECDDEKAIITPSRSRTVGVFKAFVDAVEVLSADMGDLNEAGYYHYAVIETITWGLYPIPKEQKVWKYDGGWEHCETLPPRVKQYLSRITGFCSIG
jgi:hypothetical protein